jgi:hypothetical protein
MTSAGRCPALRCRQAAEYQPFCLDHWLQLEPLLQYAVTKPTNDYDRTIACDHAAVHLAWLSGQAGIDQLEEWFGQRAAGRVAAAVTPQLPAGE